MTHSLAYLWPTLGLALTLLACEDENSVSPDDINTIVITVRNDTARPIDLATAGHQCLPVTICEEASDGDVCEPVWNTVPTWTCGGGDNSACDEPVYGLFSSIAPGDTMTFSVSVFRVATNELRKQTFFTFGYAEELCSDRSSHDFCSEGHCCGSLGMSSMSSGEIRQICQAQNYGTVALERTRNTVLVSEITGWSPVSDGVGGSGGTGSSR